jgi:hypothetical protein
MTVKKALFFVCIFLFCSMPAASAGGIEQIPPSKACSLLKSIGLPTLGWRRYVGDECGCSSRPVSIGPGTTLRNQMSYYVDGTHQTVTQLRLIVSILNPAAAEIARDTFLTAARILIQEVTSRPPPSSVSNAISNGTNLVLRTGDVMIEVARKEWTMNTDSGSHQCYDIKLLIY